MQGKHWLIVIAMLVWGACDWKVRNEYRCPDGEHCPPAGGPCSGDNECRAPTPVCNEVAMTCVECMENTDCAMARPLCEQNTCVQCRTDDDCDSKLCLDGGACAAPGDVTYVSETNATDNPTCAIDKPCQNLVQALRATSLRKYIRVTGSIVHNAATTFDNKRAIVYGRAARISRSSSDEVLILKGTSDVTLIDLEIIGNGGSGDKDCVEILEVATVAMTRVNVHGHGIAGVGLSGNAKLLMIDSQVHDNARDGIKATGGMLEIRRSLVYGNKGTAGVFAVNAVMVTIDSSTIAANTGSRGGVSIEGPFSIRNSIISSNGNISTTPLSPGGLTLNPGTAANAQFEFNTVADNSSGSTTTGLSCSGVSFDVSNSILTGNTVNNCIVSYSLTDITGTPSGTNKIGDPKFVSKVLLDPMFYRIDGMSAAVNSADPAATLDVDIDGQKRDDSRKDMGADEFK
jgi:hypothetical protein